MSDRFCEVCYRNKTPKELSNRTAWNSVLCIGYICPNCERRAKKENISILDMQGGMWASKKRMDELKKIEQQGCPSCEDKDWCSHVGYCDDDHWFWCSHIEDAAEKKSLEEQEKEEEAHYEEGEEK